MKKNSVPLLISLLIACPFAFANPLEDDTKPTTFTLDPIVVTATKTEAELLDLPQSISVMTEEEIEQLQATTLSEVLEQIPGVYTDSDNPYLSQPSIRGLDRGRVVINIDGINLTADNNKGMALSPLDIDPYLLKQVEVQKGASSTLYGSGGLGGVIAIKTKSASDLLEAGQTTGAFVRSQYSDQYNGLKNTVAAYGTTEDQGFDWLVTDTMFDNYRSSETSTRDYESHKVNAKLGLNLDADQRLQLMLSDSNRKYVSESVVNPDKADEQQVQLSYKLKRGKHVNLNATLSHTNTERKSSMVTAGQQDSKIERLQFDIQNSHYLTSGNAAHELTYGLNNYRVDQKGTIDGVADNFVTPDGTRTENALFIQDRIDWHIFTMIGALRYNHYEMDADSGDMTEDKLLPSLGITARANHWLSFHLNYSHDFRAPSIDDMFTTYYDYFGLPMDLIPNPDLKPESSKSKEIGLTLHSKNLNSTADWRVRLNYFKQDITDMITLSQIEDNPDTGNWQFTSINVDSVDRNGVELEGSFQYQNLTLGMGIDYIKEEDNSSGSTSHDRNLKVNASYLFPSQNLRVRWYGKAGDNQGDYAGYFVHNLRLNMQDAFSISGLSLSLGVDNVFDTDYYYNQHGAEGQERFYRAAVAYKF